MSDALDRDDVRAFLEVGPGMRGKLERALDALMDLLDGLDDPDLEETGDDELTGDDEVALGASEMMHQERTWKRGGPDHEDEPSLAAPERHPIVPHPTHHRHGEHVTNGFQDDQREWAAGGTARTSPRRRTSTAVTS